MSGLPPVGSSPAFSAHYPSLEPSLSSTSDSAQAGSSSSSAEIDKDKVLREARAHAEQFFDSAARPFTQGLPELVAFTEERSVLVAPAEEVNKLRESLEGLFSLAGNLKESYQLPAELLYGDNIDARMMNWTMRAMLDSILADNLNSAEALRFILVKMGCTAHENWNGVKQDILNLLRTQGFKEEFLRYFCSRFIDNHEENLSFFLSNRLLCSLRPAPPSTEGQNGDSSASGSNPIPESSQNLAPHPTDEDRSSGPSVEQILQGITAAAWGLLGVGFVAVGRPRDGLEMLGLAVHALAGEIPEELPEFHPNNDPGFGDHEPPWE